MDVTDPASSPQGVNFAPLFPPRAAEPPGIDPFPPTLLAQFDQYLLDFPNRAIMSSRRRMEIRGFLQNPRQPISSALGRDELARQRSLRHFALKYFVLDDNQIYRKAETVRGVELNRRYAACTSDAFELIAGVHRGLHHAGKSSTPYFELY